MIAYTRSKGKHTVTKPSKRKSALSAAQQRKRAAIKHEIRQRRPVHKRVLMHPTSLFALLCVGVFLCGLTSKVIADTISSVIEAPPLHSAATITAPTHGAVTQTQSVAVSGTCPVDSYVNLSLNGSFSGVSWCNSNSTYSIQASLYPNSNIVSVQAYNLTDLPGPTSKGVTVTYQPPADAPSSSSVNNSASDSSSTVSASAPTTNAPDQAPPIVLTSNFNFKSFPVQQDFSWQLDLEGGTPPYKVHIVWGDGQTSDIVFKTDPVFTISHHYDKPGYYPVKVSSADTKGQTKLMQLAALIKRADGVAPFLSTTSDGQQPSQGASGLLRDTHSMDASVKHWLVIMWPSYGIVVLMVVSFWLGESREYKNLLGVRGRIVHK